MIETVDSSCNLVQYADDTMIFTPNKVVYDSLKALEKLILLKHAVLKVTYSQ